LKPKIFIEGEKEDDEENSFIYNEFVEIPLYLIEILQDTNAKAGNGQSIASLFFYASKYYYQVPRYIAIIPF